ncbi:MAG: hypothetical protein ACPGXK_05365 [Phycisphaerae bacterium]
MHGDRSDTLSEIMDLNPSATHDFLEGFSMEQLWHYLQRLRSLPYREEFGVRRVYQCGLQEVREASLRANPASNPAL